jgi:hypothetical protein
MVIERERRRREVEVDVATSGLRQLLDCSTGDFDSEVDEE